MDYGYRSPQGQIWSCDSWQTAEETVAEAPHMTIVGREPGGAWTPFPSTARRPVPDSSHPGYSTHHDAVYADPRLTDLDTAARYISHTSSDEGATWTADPMPDGWGSVCGGHVQCEVAGALGSGWDVVANGTTRLTRHWDGSLTRWTLIVLTDEETAAMEKMIEESRARAR